MRTVDLREAEADLARLVDQAAAGEGFIIARAGEPLVRVVPLDAPAGAPAPRIGFMAGRIEVPEDFDGLGGEAIERLFLDR